jgi:hypothetical protein
MSFEPIIRTLSTPVVTGFIIGLDLGQAKDYTAIVISERSLAIETTYERGAYERDEREIDRREVAHHSIKFIHRPALGTPYPKIIEQVKSIIEDLPTRQEPPALVADATGVGRPVIDLLREAELDPIGVTITGGDRVNKVKRNDIRIPKRILAAALQIALQTGRVKIAKGLPNVDVLITELENFKVKISATGTETFEAWRESVHDDLVLATALAVWYADNLPQPIKSGGEIMWIV